MAASGRSHRMSILIVWGSALLLLFPYYYYIEFPMEKTFRKGVNDLHKNKNMQALGEFKKIIRVYPAYEPVYLNLGRLYHRDGDWDSALASYRRAEMIGIMSSEENFEHRVWRLSSSFEQKHDIDEATALYNRLVVMNYFSAMVYSYEKK
jgi:tetratricopeptide (TPR) repeat protein